MRTTPGLTLYLDASVIVSLFSVDSSTDRARVILNEARSNIAVSDFGRVEFASAIACITRVNPRRLTLASDLFASFDAWRARFVTDLTTLPADLAAAEASLRRLDTPLRTGDALHIAIAERLGATIATFDRTLAEAARSRGVAVLA